MAKITIHGFIYAEQSRSGEVRFVFFDGAGMESQGYVLVGPHETTFEVPDDLDLLAGYAANLERLQKEIRMDLERVEVKLSAIAHVRNA